MANAFHLKYTELNRSGIRGDFSLRRHPISPALDDCESKDGFTAARKTNAIHVLDGRLVVLPPDTDDGNSRNGK
jgi:hypothetical protein